MQQNKTVKKSFLSFKILLISALFYSVFFRISLGFGTLYISQIFFIIYCFINISFITNNLFRTIKSVDKYTNFVLLGAILCYGIITLRYSYYPTGTINIIITQFINILIFYVILCSLKYKKNLFERILIFIPDFQIFLSICALLEYLFSFIFRDFFIIDELSYGYFGGCRTALFFGEANWFATFCFMLYLFNYKLFVLKKISKHKFSKIFLSIIIIVFCTGSRIITLLFFIHWVLFIKKMDKYKSVVLIVFALSTLILLFPHIIFTYLPSFMQKGDLIDPGKNPRYLDAVNLIYVIDKFGVEKFGFGWGSISGLNDYFPDKREYGTTINVLPVQIYFDFGWVGCIFYSLLLIIFLFKSKDTYSLFIVISLVVLCCFHMPGYQNGIWMLLAMLYYIQNFVKKESNLAINKDQKLNHCKQ